ncbi:MAG: lysine--tRNA ligase [Thermoplasmata archaeon]
MPAEEESHLVQERRQKVARLRTAGREPYPWTFPHRVPIADVLARCAGLPPGAQEEGVTVRVAGRLKAVRSHGKSSFLDIEDLSGPLQLFARVNELGDQAYAQWLADLDPGDLVGAEGTPMVSRRGEPSLLVRDIVLLSKALTPPPEKFHGLQDPEERLRHRHVDLLSSAEARTRFRLRSLIVSELRRYLDQRGFLEVETPILVPIASGAAAQPFVARSNFLDADLQLRIAEELPLKRLLVGGLERVYEVGRCFRNEDGDTTHSPEFTMFELYWAYADYLDMRELVEGLLRHLARQVRVWAPDDPTIQGATAQFEPPFATIDFVEELERKSGISDLLSKTPEELRDLARGVGSTVPADSPAGVFLDKLFEHYVEPTLDRLTFVMDHPESTTPLAKRHRSRPGRVERFELFCKGFELGNAYTELNDPDEQERRFQEQLAARGIDHYAYDAEFVEALRYGMPPATGVGLGVDRIVMALLGVPSIKEVILFPQRRRRAT